MQSFSAGNSPRNAWKKCPFYKFYKKNAGPVSGARVH